MATRAARLKSIDGGAKPPLPEGPAKALETEAAARKAKAETDADKITRLEAELAQERNNCVILIGAIDQANADMAKITVNLNRTRGR